MPVCGLILNHPFFWKREKEQQCRVLGLEISDLQRTQKIWIHNAGLGIYLISPGALISTQLFLCISWRPHTHLNLASNTSNTLNLYWCNFSVAEYFKLLFSVIEYFRLLSMFVVIYCSRVVYICLLISLQNHLLFLNEYFMQYCTLQVFCESFSPPHIANCCRKDTNDSF